VTELESLLCDPQAADPSQTDMQIPLACELALFCHLRLVSGEPAGAPLLPDVARLAQTRLTLLVREAEALSQAHALARLPSEIARAGLADLLAALVEWAAAADILTPAELSALVAHRRRFGHPWADLERPS
jgi:hypothetical protein